MRIEEVRRRGILKQIPPRMCTARAKTRNLEPCKHWAMVGLKVCNMHGGMAPQSRAAAERRISLAEALAQNREPRHPWELLNEAAHLADILLQEAKTQVIEKGPNTPVTLLEQMITAIERMARLAKMNLDAGNDERRTALFEAQAGHLHRVFSKVLTALDLTPEQAALVPLVLAKEIQAVTRPPAIEGKVVRTRSDVRRSQG